MNHLSHPPVIFLLTVAAGKSSVSNNLSTQATQLGHVSPPLPLVERPPTPPPVAAPATEIAPVPAPTPSPAQTRSKATKQLRAEKNRKGKHKAAATVTKDETVVEQEEVPIPQPPVSQKTGLDAAIDNMVNTGNFQSTLEQMNFSWR